MKPTSARCSPIAVVALMFLAALGTPANAQRANTHVGQWLHVIVEEPTTSRGSCRHVDVITRTYNLQGAPNGGVAGGYFQQTERGWFVGATDGCQSDEGPDPGDPRRFFRNDLWMVSGERVGEDTVKITGRYGQCVGSCTSQTNVAQRFETMLVVRNGLLEDVEQKNKLSAYRPADIVTRDAHSAAAAFLELLRPLLARNCNAFYLSSLDPEQRSAVPQDKFCEIASQMSQFLRPVLYDEPLSAFSASVGSLRASGPALFGNGDVLVQRALTVSGGGKVVMRAILRKQSDAGWKVLRLIP